MIRITAFDQQRKPSFSVSLSDARNAAKAALGAVRNSAFPFAKIENASGTVIVSQRSQVGVSRLADAIATEANVEFA